MTLLVAGRQRVDAGKTTFSTGLAVYTGAVGFKPRAGNDYWFHHDDYLQSTGNGSLYGKDARRLAGASPGQLDPTDVNPIHRLWRPSPGPGTGLLGQSDRSFVLDRVGESYLVNGRVEVPDAARERLPLADATVIESVEELNAAIQQYHLPALDALERTIERTARAVVESYADVARPIQDLDPDAVAVVGPGRARIYDGSRYAKGCSVAPGGTTQMEGRLEKRVADVTDLIDPVTTVALPGLPSAERSDPDKVAAAYEPAYERLLDVANWQ